MLEATTWYRAVCDACQEPLDLDGGEYRRTVEGAGKIALEEGWDRDRRNCWTCAECKAAISLRTAARRKEPHA
jgi:hypothetical protein